MFMDARTLLPSSPLRIRYLFIGILKDASFLPEGILGSPCHSTHLPIANRDSLSALNDQPVGCRHRSPLRQRSGISLEQIKTDGDLWSRFPPRCHDQASVNEQRPPS